MPAALTWSATGGTITSGGLYTSGAAAGNYPSDGHQRLDHGLYSNYRDHRAGEYRCGGLRFTSAGDRHEYRTIGSRRGRYRPTDLTYTWSTISAPTGAPAVTFNANGSNAAKNATATFPQAGIDTFLVTVSDDGVTTATSSVSVLVNQTLTIITVSPAASRSTRTARSNSPPRAIDQFGQPDSVSLTWTATGGSIEAADCLSPGSLPEIIWPPPPAERFPVPQT